MISYVKRHVKVAAAQLTPTLYNKGEAINKVCKAIEKAGRNSAELIVFPETFIHLAIHTGGEYYPYLNGLT